MRYGTACLKEGPPGGIGFLDSDPGTQATQPMVVLPRLGAKGSF